jgi:hypothetical protein
VQSSGGTRLVAASSDAGEGAIIVLFARRSRQSRAEKQPPWQTVTERECTRTWLPISNEGWEKTQLPCPRRASGRCSIKLLAFTWRGLETHHVTEVLTEQRRPGVAAVAQRQRTDVRHPHAAALRQQRREREQSGAALSHRAVRAIARRHIYDVRREDPLSWEKWAVRTSERRDCAGTVPRQCDPGGLSGLGPASAFFEIVKRIVLYW